MATKQESGAPNSVCVAKLSVQEELVRLGFLLDRDRGDVDAVADAALRFFREGTDLFESVDALFASLRDPKRRLDAAESLGRDGSALRDAPLYALDAVVRFLMLFEQVHAESLVTLLARLFGDLKSLDDGTVSAMLAPAKRPGRACAGGFYNHLKGISIFIVQRLKASGMSEREARKAVAQELNRQGIRPARRGSSEGHGLFSERTIKKWAEDIAADVGMSTPAAQEFRQCQEGYLHRILDEVGISSLPTGSTADELELSRIGVGEFRRAYLDKLGQYAYDTGLARKST
jgi:hypothetical protein